MPFPAQQPSLSFTFPRCASSRPWPLHLTFSACDALPSPLALLVSTLLYTVARWVTCSGKRPLTSLLGIIWRLPASRAHRTDLFLVLARPPSVLASCPFLTHATLAPASDFAHAGPLIWRLTSLHPLGFGSDVISTRPLLPTQSKGIALPKTLVGITYLFSSS